jgi:hypothetical protein
MAVILNASTSSGFVQSADTSGEINLQSNGSTKLSVLSTGVSGTLVQGTAVASTSGTSIDFTGIPSWVKRITVMLNGVSGSGTSPFLIQIGSGSVTTSGYYSAASTIGASVASTSSTAGFVLMQGVGASEVVYGNFVLCLQTGNSWVSSSVLARNTAGTHTSGGFLALGGVLDRVRITTVNGTDTFDAGTINLQYEG